MICRADRDTYVPPILELISVPNMRPSTTTSFFCSEFRQIWSLQKYEGIVWLQNCCWWSSNWRVKNIHMLGKVCQTKDFGGIGDGFDWIFAVSTLELISSSNTRPGSTASLFLFEVQNYCWWPIEGRNVHICWVKSAKPLLWSLEGLGGLIEDNWSKVLAGSNESHMYGVHFSWFISHDGYKLQSNTPSTNYNDPHIISTSTLVVHRPTSKNKDTT